MEPTLFQNSVSKVASLQEHATTPGNHAITPSIKISSWYLSRAFYLFIYLFIFLLFGDESLIIFINEKNILYKKKLMKMVLGFLSYHFNQFFV